MRFLKNAAISAILGIAVTMLLLFIIYTLILAGTLIQNVFGNTYVTIGFVVIVVGALFGVLLGDYNR